MKRLLAVIILVLVLAMIAGEHAAAAGPYTPSADTYTDRNNETATHGSDTNLLLSASTLAGCVETTYLWFKFAIPSTGTTISSASLALTFGSGSGTTDLELRSSADTSWTETGLNWSNQPGLDTTVLATATGATSGSTVTFSGATLTAYLNGRQGQTVSLVVRANCGGSVSTSVALPLRARENASGSSASLSLYGPNVVTLRSLTARSDGIVGLPGLVMDSMAGEAAITLVGLGAGILAWRRRRR